MNRNEKIGKDVVLDMLDDIESEVAEGLGYQYQKWREYINDYKPESGEWVYDENGVDYGHPAWVCSNCGQKNDMIPTWIQYPVGTKKVTNPYDWAGSQFCPNCGLPMRRKER